MENKEPEKISFLGFLKQAYQTIEEESKQKFYDAMASINQIEVLNLSYEQFYQMYYEKLAPKFMDLAITQSKLNKNNSDIWGPRLLLTVFPIFTLVFTSVIIYSAFFAPHKEKEALIALPFIWLFWLWLPFKAMGGRKLQKDYFKEALFTSLDAIYVRGHNLNAFFWYNFNKVFRKFPFFLAFFDETLCFKYKDKPLALTEYIRWWSFKRTMICSYPTDKNFKGETIIFSKKRIIPPSTSIGELISLEDPLFNKNFEVFTDNQVEARYLLTTAFMERLLNFQKKYNCVVDVLFSNETAPDLGNVFLSITSKRDFFKLPSSWINNPSDIKPIYKIIQEVKEIAEILDALKLDQDIGL